MKKLEILMIILLDINFIIILIMIIALINIYKHLLFLTFQNRNHYQLGDYNINYDIQEIRNFNIKNNDIGQNNNNNENIFNEC